MLGSVVLGQPLAEDGPAGDIVGMLALVFAAGLCALVASRIGSLAWRRTREAVRQWKIQRALWTDAADPVSAASPAQVSGQLRAVESAFDEVIARLEAKVGADQRSALRAYRTSLSDLRRRTEDSLADHPATGPGGEGIADARHAESRLPKGILEHHGPPADGESV